MIPQPDPLITRHRRACDGFAAVAEAVPADRWSALSPCTEWDARAVVEHVIGFHEFLLLRPMGLRANRPRDDEAARWRATAAALFDALQEPGALDRKVGLVGGGESTPRTMLAALTIDVLIHTWDLARATGVTVTLDTELTDLAYDAALASRAGRASSDMFAPEVDVAADADTLTKLLALNGRSPTWPD